MVTKLEKLKSQLHAAKEAYKMEVEERRRLDDELTHQAEGYEESIVCLQTERDELKRKIDDLSIRVQHYGDQAKKWQEHFNEAHQESVQTAKQLHEAKQSIESINRLIKDYDRDVAKAIAACRQHLQVSLNLPVNKPDCDVCETSRFVYYLLDILDGK